MIKKIVALVLFVGLTYTTNAQVQTPQPSPFSTVEQKVGLTDVTIEYSRPGVKGRTIFGGLEAFGKVWRTGANSRTKITFSDNVTIDGKELEAGTYAIFTIPNKESWDFIFYTDSKGSGAPAELDESKVALRTITKVHEIPFNVESLTLDINNLRDDSATLDLMWEKTYVSVPFSVPTEVLANASIDKVMAGPSVNDYVDAATYYYDNDINLNKAKEWIDKAVELREKPAFWHIRKQALIYAKLGDKKGAIKAAKRSLELATEAGYDSYIKMNEASIAEWMK
jgi:hypothetical protein